MRCAIPFLAALTLASACATAPPAPPPVTPSEPIDPFVLQIEIGRWGAMLWHVHDLTMDPDGEFPAEGNPEEPKLLARALRERVWDYNLQRSRLCGLNYLPAVTCGTGYAPDWLSEAPDAAPDLAVLQARSNEFGDRVMAFWDAVCTDARSKITNADERSQVCGIE